MYAHAGPVGIVLEKVSVSAGLSEEKALYPFIRVFALNEGNVAGGRYRVVVIGLRGI